MSETIFWQDKMKIIIMSYYIKAPPESSKQTEIDDMMTQISPQTPEPYSPPPPYNLLPVHLPLDSNSKCCLSPPTESAGLSLLFFFNHIFYFANHWRFNILIKILHAGPDVSVQIIQNKEIQEKVEFIKFVFLPSLIHKGFAICTCGLTITMMCRAAY